MAGSAMSDSEVLEALREEQARQWKERDERGQVVGWRAAVMFFMPTLQRLSPGRSSQSLRVQMRRLVAAGELKESRSGRMVYWYLSRRRDG